MRLHAWLVCALLAACLAARPIAAQDEPAAAQDEPAATQDNEEEAENAPVALVADEVVFDETLNLVIARGNVEITQADRILRADQVTYNQRTEVLTATGNVVLVEPDGEVLFADYAELEDDLANGFAQSVGILLTDDSRIAANSAVRRENGQISEMERAVYSPCQLCPEDPDRAPLWQMRAVRVIHDREARDIIYRDAFLDMWGVPVLYTPYFSHPDPTVDRRTGFLTPRFGTTSNLGPFLIGAFYWDIAPSVDTTINFGATRDAGFILGANYRQRFEDGVLLLDGSVNRSELIRNAADPQPEEQWRGHLFGTGRLDLTEHWRAGADVQLVSDDTYLSVFEISDEDFLTNRAFVEGFYGLSYVSGELYDFRDLRANSVDQPSVLPLLRFDYVSEPDVILGGQWIANGNVLNLERSFDATRRVSAETGWQTVHYTDFGLVTDASATVRTDFYSSEDVRDPDNPDQFIDDGTSYRLYPLASITARYPLVRQQGRVQQLIEPIVGITAASEIGDADDIPNNDSVGVEFDEINLLEDNRFPGFDRVEEGLRFTYGAKFGLYGFGGGTTTLFVGQSYRLDDDDTFPEGSGLEDRLSDIVGRLTIRPSSLFNFDYRFRFDHETLEPNAQQIRAAAGPPILRLGTTYTQVSAQAGTITEEDSEEIIGTASSQFAEHWLASAAYRRDLQEGANRDIGFGVTYFDECFTFGVNYRRDFTSDRDVSSGNSIFIYISFRNLAEIPIALDSGDLFQ